MLDSHAQPMNVISLLTKSELFAGVDSATLERLGESSTEHRLRRGDKLFEENDVANDLYIVTSGRIAIANKSIDGRESMVALMESGDRFGEMPLFDSLGRSAEARALEQSVVVSVPYEPIRALYEQRPELLWAVVRLLAGRLRNMSRNVTRSSTSSAESVERTSSRRCRYRSSVCRA